MSWMEEVAEAAQTRFANSGVRLTLGGEPTLVPVQPEGPEWNFSADGPTKLPWRASWLRIYNGRPGQAAP